jgi:signal transduction histidine kinase
MLFAIKQANRDVFEIQLPDGACLTEDLGNLLIDFVSVNSVNGARPRLSVQINKLGSFPPEACAVFDQPRTETLISRLEFVTSCSQTSRIIADALSRSGSSLPKAILFAKPRGANTVTGELFIEVDASIAHEINNPLAVVIGSTELLLDLLNDPNAERALILRNAQRVLRTSRQIAQIVRNVKELSNPSASKSVLHKDTDLGDLIRDALVGCHDDLAKAGVRYEINSPDPSTRIGITCSPIQIQQIITNLVNNAKDAIEHLPEKWICIRYERRGELACLTVSDSGPGIPAHLHDKIMQPLFTTKVPGKGTGLGLAICARIAAAHNGRVFVNWDAKNTEFCLELPCADMVAHGERGEISA